MRKQVLICAVLAFVALSSCSHDMKVAMQERVFAPQLNRGLAEVKAADLQALAVGTTQEKVLEVFGTPIMVHVEGTPCTPWNSCQYASAKLTYRTKEAWTCTVTFLSGKIDRPATCEPYRTQLILGPGDIDPQTGLTGNP